MPSFASTDSAGGELWSRLGETFNNAFSVVVDGRAMSTLQARLKAAKSWAMPSFASMTPLGRSFGHGSSALPR